MTTVAAIAMARIIGAPPHRIGSFYLACGAIGSNIQTRSKEPVNVSNSLHRPARPSSRQRRLQVQHFYRSPAASDKIRLLQLNQTVP
jgi:hypothetical protein